MKMKKLFVLLLTLCLVCVSASALASAVTADGSALILDDFSLNLPEGEMYMQNEKKVGTIMLTVYPRAASYDTATNYNIVWVGSIFPMTTDLLNANKPSLEQETIAGITQAGYGIDGYTAGDAYDTTLHGEPCVALDTQMVMSLGEQSAPIYQRQLYFGGRGYVLTISASTAEDRDAVFAELDNILVFVN